MGDISDKMDDVENKAHELKGRMEQKKDDMHDEDADTELICHLGNKGLAVTASPL